MERTAELRWFFPGTPPEPVRRWFDEFGEPPEDRLDRYLRLPGTDALGVKVRSDGGRLEVKLRCGDPKPYEPAPGVAGEIEEWAKWSFPRLGPVARLAPRLGVGARFWLEVAKRRRTAAYPGCRVELAEVRAGGAHRCTLAFEAAAPGPRRLPALRAAAEAFFHQVGLEDGAGGEPSGYPAWINSLDPG